jgi:hypothetical protein
MVKMKVGIKTEDRETEERTDNKTYELCAKCETYCYV